MAHWVTPPAVMDDGKLTTLGEINYGSESRMFIFAGRDTDVNQIVTDTSVPAYHKIVDLTPAEYSLFTDEKYIIINSAEIPLTNTTEIPLTYTQSALLKDTGLKLSSNGQIVGRLRISDTMKHLVFKVQYIDPPAYTQGVEYRAYSHIHSNGRLYRLGTNTTLPYHATSGTPVTDDWIDIGKYTPQYNQIKPYVNKTYYSILDRVVSNGKIWQLNTNVSSKFKTRTAAPDLVYWRKLGAISESVLVYKNNSTYDVDSKVSYNNEMYQLSNTQPYYSNSVIPDELFWNDIGKYSGNIETNPTRLFSIIINTRRSSLITFATDAYLGAVQIGHKIGNSNIKNVVANSDTIISYELVKEHQSSIGKRVSADDDGIYWVLPKGLTFHADGTISGHPVGPVGTYKFDIIARNSTALEKIQTFELRITAGYTNTSISATLRPKFDIERQWYNMISSDAFTKVNLYRPSDPSFGLQDYPNLLIKRNLLGVFLNKQLDLTTIQPLLCSKLNAIPSIGCRLGNMRYRTALDENGNPLYDLLYKEVIPLSMSVVYDANAVMEPVIRLPEIYTLKNTLTALLQSDNEPVEDDILRGQRIEVNGISSYDDLELWETNHNSKTYEFGYKAVVPVAYTLPGEADKFIKRAIEYGTLGKMLINHTLTLDNLIVTDMTSETHHSIVVPLFSE